MKYLVLLSCLWISIGSEFVSYDGFKTFEVYPANRQQLNILMNLAENHDYDIWSLSQLPGSPSTIMVAPEAQANFVKLLQYSNIPHSVLIEDLGSVIRAQRPSQNHIHKSSNGAISFTKYARYNTIINYLLKLSQIYPDIVSLVPPGTTYEGRKVQPIKIGTEGENKPIILVDGGIHAREWISPAVVLYLINELVKEENRYMIEYVDWYIIPLLNPDGYEYSHKDRLWRKNRHPNKPGVDLNRNFNLSWTSEGWYGNSCDYEQYSGEQPFDQKETQFLRDLVQRNSNNIKLYVTVHSYVSLTYGSSVDWVKGAAGIDLTYAIELPGKGYGFLLPPKQIMNVCKETFPAFKTFHNYIQEKFART